MLRPFISEEFFNGQKKIIKELGLEGNLPETYQEYINEAQIQMSMKKRLDWNNAITPLQEQIDYTYKKDGHDCWENGRALELRNLIVGYNCTGEIRMVIMDELFSIALKLNFKENISITPLINFTTGKNNGFFIHLNGRLVALRDVLLEVGLEDDESVVDRKLAGFIENEISRIGKVIHNVTSHGDYGMFGGGR